MTVTQRVSGPIRSTHGIDGQPPGLEVERREDDGGAGVFGGEPPRREVRVVLEPGREHLVARAERAADGPGEREDQRGAVGAEDDAVRIGAEERGDGLARGADHLAGRDARGEPPTAVGVGAAARGTRAIASMAVSTICVPAGPSKRAHSSSTPGKRSRTPGHY